MSVVIQLDRQHAHFTNLDFVTGRLLVHLTSETSIDGIQVKLEGESKTRLAGPRHGSVDRNDRRRTELEVHKILYKVVTVFPAPGLNQPISPVTSFTFAPGTYEYPFQFKFPFNNDCSSHNSMLTNLNFTGRRVEVARNTDRHVKKTLPPSLSGFPGEAEIKYYVKATVSRPEFYKGNIRGFAPLNFLPIEPPRMRNPDEETYARRQHQFSKTNNAAMKTKGIFSKTPPASMQDPPGEPPRVSVDARLPNPPILTCNEPIPLRILVKQVTASPYIIFLQMLQIELVAYTHIRAHDLARDETGSFIITSRSNMAIPLGHGGEPAGTEWTLDSGIWRSIPLPNSVAPSFEICNVSRTYQLEVRVGLSYGRIGHIKPQLIVLPLRMPVKVYSGIAPPQALLDAMATSAPSAATKLSAPPTEPSSRPPVPPRPAEAEAFDGVGEIYDEAPPSYEDAIAETLNPVDGPRREYNPPATSNSARSTVDSETAANSSARTAKDHPERGPFTNARTNSSSESFDMLPSTPPETHTGSPTTSPASRPLNTMKVARNNENRGTGHAGSNQETLPEYQAYDDGQVPPPGRSDDTRPSGPAMNLGVPSRKPVPRSPGSGPG